MPPSPPSTAAGAGAGAGAGVGAGSRVLYWARVGSDGILVTPGLQPVVVAVVEGGGRGGRGGGSGGGGSGGVRYIGRGAIDGGVHPGSVEMVVGGEGGDVGEGGEGGDAAQPLGHEPLLP